MYMHDAKLTWTTQDGLSTVGIISGAQDGLEGTVG